MEEFFCGLTSFSKNVKDIALRGERRKMWRNRSEKERERGGESERGNERGRTGRSEKEHFIGHLLIVRSVNKKTNSLIAFMKVQQKNCHRKRSPKSFLAQFEDK